MDTKQKLKYIQQRIDSAKKYKPVSDLEKVRQVEEIRSWRKLQDRIVLNLPQPPRRAESTPFSQAGGLQFQSLVEGETRFHRNSKN